MRARRRQMLCALVATALTGAIVVRSHAAERVIPIRARKFTYDPDELVLKMGEPVVLEFTSQDVTMGFSAPDFAVRSDIFPGQTSRVRFVPDKPGTFVFHCDIFCGDGHESMDGTIRVVA